MRHQYIINHLLPPEYRPPPDLTSVKLRSPPVDIDESVAPPFLPTNI